MQKERKLEIVLQLVTEQTVTGSIRVSAVNLSYSLFIFPPQSEDQHVCDGMLVPSTELPLLTSVCPASF